MVALIPNLFETGNSESGFWPTIDQRLLLRMILGLEPEIKSAYASWRTMVDIESLGQASLRLLPLLAPQLSNVDIPEIDRSILHSARRITWWRNQMRLHTLVSIDEALEGANVAYISLKGMGLIIDGTYSNMSDRPTEDIDILIHPEDLELSLDALMSDGWERIPSERDVCASKMIATAHAASLTRGAEEELDLHWGLFHRYGKNDNKLEFIWRNSQHVALRDKRFLTLSPTDQLFHTCVHGARWAYWVSPIRWLVDAYRIIEIHHKKLDWDRLVSLSIELDLVIPVRKTLQYLVDNFDVKIPAHVIPELNNAKISISARMSEFISNNPFMLASYPLRILKTFRYARQEHQTLRAKLLNLPLYTRHIFKVPEDQSFAVEIWRKFCRLINRVIKTRRI